MLNEPLNILFIHGGWPNQFSPLHAYFQETKLAHSMCLTSAQDVEYFRQNDPKFPPDVFPFRPDGQMSPDSYYYSGIAERSARHGISVLQATRHIATSRKLDLIVVHAVLGYSYLLFDEVNVPIISYVEYPSFRHHRWDPQYPPMDGQRYCDKFDEMINYFAAAKSDLVITPSLYAKSMFPEAMQGNIVAQMEAFNPKVLQAEDPSKAAFEKEPGKIYVGFSANVLSSEKGLEQFIATSKRLSALNPDVRYVMIGDVKGPGYCFEYIFLEQRFGKDSGITFRDYLFQKYEVNPELYISTGRLPKEEFGATVNAVDFFLYPLQFGSANWGLYELLLRGKIVIASDRCFVPEAITHNENGFLLAYEDVDGWAKLANDIARNLPGYRKIGETAAKRAEKFHVENTAKEYLDIFRNVVAKRKKPFMASAWTASARAGSASAAGE